MIYERVVAVMLDRLVSICIGFGMVLFFIFGILYVGTILSFSFDGLGYFIGNIWLFYISSFFLLLFFGIRFHFPVMIFAFLGAIYVWKWHWALAALLVCPNLIFVIPGRIIAVFEFAIEIFQSRFKKVTH